MKVTKHSDYAEIALRITYRVLLPRIFRQSIPSVLSLKRPSYETGLTRTHDFILQMSEEMGEWWERTARLNEASSVSDWKKIERSQMCDAALELVEVIRGMPRPVRDVLERRAAGMSWKAIQDDLPKRAYFSIMDDWKGALRKLNEGHHELLLRFI